MAIVNLKVELDFEGMDISDEVARMLGYLIEKTIEDWDTELPSRLEKYGYIDADSKNLVEPAWKEGAGVSVSVDDDL